MSYDEILVKYREKVLAGLESESLIGLLKEEGAPPMDCIKAVRELYSISLGEAKRYVFEHSAWKEESLVNRELADEVINSFES